MGIMARVPAWGLLCLQHSILTSGSPCAGPRGPTLTYTLCLCPLQLTFVTGEKTTEIFIQSLELGHSATTRAIKASGGHRGNPYRDGQEVESERKGSKERRGPEGRQQARR